MTKLRILLADDHAVLRDGLRVLVNGQPDMEVIAEAKDGREALKKIMEFRPDVAIVDVSMPELDGIKVTEKVKQQLPDVKVLALTAYRDRSYLDQLLRVGGAGFVLKGSPAEEVIEAIRNVALGRAYVDPKMALEIAGSYARKHVGGRTSQREITNREEQVLRLIAQGFSNKEIAAKLAISVKTVETHKANAMEKLEFQSRAELVRYAVRKGWLHDS